MPPFPPPWNEEGTNVSLSSLVCEDSLDWLGESAQSGAWLILHARIITVGFLLVCDPPMHKLGVPILNKFTFVACFGANDKNTFSEKVLASEAGEFCYTSRVCTATLARIRRHLLMRQHRAQKTILPF